jgi:hypothetical protein
MLVPPDIPPGLSILPLPTGNHGSDLNKHGFILPALELSTNEISWYILFIHMLVYSNGLFFSLAI